MANWFLALSIDPRGWYPDRVGDPPAGLRAFHPDDLHATIAFLGDVGEARARAAWEALAWPQRTFAVELAEVAAMGNARRYSALSVLIARGGRELEACMGERRAAAARAAGIEHDARPPKAHITIARPSRSATKDQRHAGLAWAGSLRLAGVPIGLEQVALYTWSDTRSDPCAPQFRRVITAG